MHGTIPHHVYIFQCVLLLFLGEWTSPTVTGKRPPPICNFTLTSITNTTAILFGGNIGNYISSSDVYIFEFADTYKSGEYNYYDVSY